MLLLAAAKLILGDTFEITPLASLAAIACVLLAAIGASSLFPETRKMTACTHRNQIKDVTPNTEGCEVCLKTGDRWVQLRMCLACGHVGCCDSSKNKHATAHFHATGHPGHAHDRA